MKQPNRPQTTLLGTFVITSGEMRVTDPCYDVDTSCAGKFKALNGEWRGLLVTCDERSFGRRVFKLRAAHKDHLTDLVNSEPLEIDVGVDSGQCGLFDAGEYASYNGDDRDLQPVEDPKDRVEAMFGRAQNKEPLYDKICDLTCGPKQGGLVKNWGIVSSSGYGDGSYRVRVAKNAAGEVTAAEVLFMFDPMDEEDVEEDTYDEDDEFDDEDVSEP